MKNTHSQIQLRWRGAKKGQRGIKRERGLKREREIERERGRDGKSTASNAHNEINFQSIAAT